MRPQQRGGGHSGGRKHAPSLPAELLQALGPNSSPAHGGTSSRHGHRGGGMRGGGRGGGRGGCGGGGGSRGGPAVRKDQRKAERAAKKQRRAASQHHRRGGGGGDAAGHGAAGPGPAGSAKRPPPLGAPPLGEGQGAAKRPRTDAPQQTPRQPTAAAPAAPAAAAPPALRPQQRQQQRPPARGAAAAGDAGGGGGGAVARGRTPQATRFAELLAAPLGDGGRAGFEADAALAARMERLLGAKGKRKRSTADDGLEDLLEGLTAGTQLLPSYMAGAHTAPRKDGADSSDDEEGGAFGSSGSGSEGGEGDSGSDADSGGGGAEGGSSDGFGSSGGSEEGLSGDVGEEGSQDEGEGEGELLGSSGEEFGGGLGLDSESELEEGEEEEEEEGWEGRGSSEDEGDEGSSGDGDVDDGRRGQVRAGAAPGSAVGAAAAAAAEAPPPQRYVPPALRAAGGDGATAAVERRMTGLLNRLTEANLQAICTDVADLYSTAGRRVVTEAITQQLLAACAEGPRASEAFAAVAAAFVGGLAGRLRAQDMAARFLEATVLQLEQAYTAGKPHALHNLGMLLAYLYSTGLVSADFIYSTLSELTRRFTETDVVLMVVLLNAVGLQLRSDDPAAMKEFVVGVHAAAAGAGKLTKRTELMLELVMDIKNNRPRQAVKAAAAAAAAGAGAAAARRGGAAVVLNPVVLKWLRSSGVADVQLVNLSWAKVTAPDKKGMWWLPAAGDAAAGLLPGLLAESRGGGGGGGGGTAGAASAGDGDGELGADLLQLAAAQRMNTDTRRAVFVAIMGSEDALEAAEKLLRLPLKGEQEREVMRVLVDCAVQETGANPYYAALGARVAAASKGHRLTLQYALWDRLKEVPSMAVGQLTNVAHLAAGVVARGALTLGQVAKTVDFDALSSPKLVFFWRLVVLQLLRSCRDPRAATALFGRVAAAPGQGALAKALSRFLGTRVGPWLVSGQAPGVPASSVEGADADQLLLRLAAGEKALADSVGAVLEG